MTTYENRSKVFIGGEMDFLGLGPLELLVILVIALLFFDPAKLPEIARSLGKVMRQLRQAVSDLSQSAADIEAPLENKAGNNTQRKGLPIKD